MTNRTTTPNHPSVAMTNAAIRFRHAERALLLARGPRSDYIHADNMNRGTKETPWATFFNRWIW